MSDLIKRLREVQGHTTKSYRNPDGPEAADRIEELERQLNTCPDCDGTLQPHPEGCPNRCRDQDNYDPTLVRRIAELEGALEEQNYAISIRDNRIATLEAEDAKLREALEKIAKHTYNPSTPIMDALAAQLVRSRLSRFAYKALAAVQKKGDE
jgi:uncharacterized coiled-coil protein SlyX